MKKVTFVQVWSCRREYARLFEAASSPFGKILWLYQAFPVLFGFFHIFPFNDIKLTLRGTSITYFANSYYFKSL